MSIRVKDFKWDKGKNDLEYIELLEKNLESSLSTYRECVKTAREQYKKGYDKGRADRDREITESNVFFANKPIEDIVLDAIAGERKRIVRELETLRDEAWQDTDSDKRIVRSNAWDKVDLINKAIEIVRGEENEQNI